MINNCMSKHERHHQIQQQASADTATANQWIRAQGLDAGSFHSTPIRLLQAQQQAHTLLTQHWALLSTEQRAQLQLFMQQMRCKRTRSQLKPQAANSVLNISSKIHRQLFRQQKFRSQAPHQANVQA
jgi:hypothetical protein